VIQHHTKEDSTYLTTERHTTETFDANCKWLVVMSSR